MSPARRVVILEFVWGSGGSEDLKIEGDRLCSYKVYASFYEVRAQEKCLVQ